MTRRKTTGDIPPTRRQFMERLRARLGELGVHENHERWLEEHIGVRWQTAQFWLRGDSFPTGHSLVVLAQGLGVDPNWLVGPMVDDVEARYPSWTAFLETPEGRSLTNEERWPLRLFSWPKPPTVGDYRSLLALVRTNAERA